MCSSVKKSLLDTKTQSFTSVKATFMNSLKDAIAKLLTASRNIDVLRDAITAKKKGQVYSIVHIGVNGVGKSTTLAKIAYYLKTKGNLRVMFAACDNFRAGAIE